ncbi:hypothetical protein ABZP36_005691 [Zizania latifolia]
MDLLRLLAPAPVLPLMLHGGAATGKTRALFLELRHLCPCQRLVYAALRSLPSRPLRFSSLLSSAQRHSPVSTSSRQRLPDKPSDFVVALRNALTGIVSQGEVVYLVFDNLDVVRRWDKGDQLLSLFLGLHDLLQLPQVVLVVALKPLFRVTTRVDELSVVLEPLFRRYCEPLGDSKPVPDEGDKRRLFEHVQPHLAVALNETLSVPMRASMDEIKDSDYAGKGSAKRQFGGREGLSSELEFHMPVSSKYLLLSAFLA